MNEVIIMNTPYAVDMDNVSEETKIYEEKGSIYINFYINLYPTHTNTDTYAHTFIHLHTYIYIGLCWWFKPGNSVYSETVF